MTQFETQVAWEINALSKQINVDVVSESFAMVGDFLEVTISSSERTIMIKMDPLRAKTEIDYRMEILQAVVSMLVPRSNLH